MFELLFHHPLVAFTKGKLIFLSSMPGWLFALLAVAGSALLAYLAFRNGAPRLAHRWIPVWLLQTAMFALVLALLWQPALSLSTLKPQQNVVALVFDDSRSMAVEDHGGSRIEALKKAASDQFINKLKSKFQVRLYRLSGSLEPLGSTAELKAEGSATHFAPALRLLAAESASLPIGAVVLFSDGGDNAGGVDLRTMTEIRSRKLPVHTVGFGSETMPKDLEITGVQLPWRALPDSRLQALVKYRQRGWSGAKTKLIVRHGDKILSSREITLGKDGVERLEPIIFQSGNAGVRNIQVTLEPLSGEANTANNSLTRVLSVENRTPRILYIEGEPKWEFKFIRRAAEEDPTLQLTTMLRTTQNKIYRQGIRNPKELEEGFPSKLEELFDYQGLVIGGVEAGYFSATQVELIRQFADRRGGGILFLAGRGGLSDGGFAKSGLAELLPVTLPDRKQTFVRDPATVELTPVGRDSLITRIEEDPEKNFERWKKLPYLANYQDVGLPKPGAVVLAEASVPGRGKLPLLVTQNYGAGRTAVLATAGTWRWQMVQPLEDKSHEMFWQQLLRWLVADTRGRVSVSAPERVLQDDGALKIAARVKDMNYLPCGDAAVEAHIVGPEGLSAVVDLHPDAAEPGGYSAEWFAPRPGGYAVEVIARRGEQELGRDAFAFRREDGVAENFRQEQNRELLEKLAEQSGGRYWKPEQLDRLVKEIEYSEAGLTVRETKELWNMPAIFLLLLGLRASEWLLRRRWGAV
jgi:uncharacterized membrane protein